MVPISNGKKYSKKVPTFSSMKVFTVVVFLPPPPRRTQNSQTQLNFFKKHKKMSAVELIFPNQMANLYTISCLKVEPVYFWKLYISAGNDEHKNKDISGSIGSCARF